MDLREIGIQVVDWMHLDHSREKCNEPSGSIKGGEFKVVRSGYGNG
jgi:hypothetical protein